MLISTTSPTTVRPLLFFKELDPIQSSLNKFDHIKELEEEERLRDLKNQQGESHLLEILVVLACLALLIIIAIKCFCDKSPTTASNWFNTKAHNPFSRRRRNSPGQQPSSIEPVTVSSLAVHISVAECKLHGPDAVKQVGEGGDQPLLPEQSGITCSCKATTIYSSATPEGEKKHFVRKKSQAALTSLELDDKNPYQPTTST